MNGYDTLTLRSAQAIAKLGCGCGCSDCNHDDAMVSTSISGLSGFTDSSIGKYGRSRKPIVYYVSMGGEASKTKPLNDYGYAFHGKIQRLNTAKTWAEVYDAATGKNFWIPFVSNPDLVWAVNFAQNGTAIAPSSEAELQQARDIAAGIIKDQDPNAYKYVATKAVDVAEGAGDALKSGLDLVGFVGRNLKWFLIGGGLLIAAYYGAPVIKQLTSKK